MKEVKLYMKNKISKNFLISFSNEIKNIYEKGKIRAPIHLSGNNENQLIKIFKNVKKQDWVFSTWRSHYHALLHGINPIWLKNEIIKGRSMGIINKKKKILRFSYCWWCFAYCIRCCFINKKKERKK